VTAGSDAFAHAKKCCARGEIPKDKLGRDDIVGGGRRQDPVVVADTPRGPSHPISGGSSRRNATDSRLV